MLYIDCLNDSATFYSFIPVYYNLMLFACGLECWTTRMYRVNGRWKNCDAFLNGLLVAPSAGKHAFEGQIFTL
jgi:hypothetical protein